ncbi:hypothetical protein NDU88_005137 [Pleurodeles waltl]|uniref:Uncharacterized protein n=1 Tax=Pleurodeles waltl TaxID=8319 RepID=A0AAV7V6E8_PLEWA|nr:hypothetical protein NDU88_005137 [Pleurodeles waltl]
MEKGLRPGPIERLWSPSTDGRWKAPCWWYYGSGWRSHNCICTCKPGFDFAKLEEYSSIEKEPRTSGEAQ